MIVVFVGVSLNTRIQEQVKESGVCEGSSLYNLADHMTGYIVNSRSDNTAKSYFNAFKRWELFINSHGFNALPALPVHIALYLTHLLDTGATCNTVNSAVYGIKWVHELNNYTDPTNNSYVHSLVESAKRVACPVKQKKDPVTVEMLINLCDKYSNCTDLLIVRDLTMILLCFSGFLRYDEVSSLLCKNVKIKDNFLVLYIKKSKTDQYCNGNEVLITKGSSSACPYSMFLRCKNLSEVSLESDFFLFRPFDLYFVLKVLVN